MSGFEPKTGYHMKLYRNTGTFATPVWVEIAEIGDLSISDFTRALAELKRRGNQYTKNLASLFNSITVEFRLHFGLATTQWNALKTAFFAGTPVEFAIMSGAIATSGEEGLRCPMIVSQFPWEQNLEDASGHDVQLSIAYMVSGSAEVDPTWLSVA